MTKKNPVFSLINLGCAKNTVDSEGLLATMALAGFVFCPDPAYADVCVVNTCGFLDSSRREAAGVIDDLATARQRVGARRPYIVVTGCLVERAGGTSGLVAFLQQADACVGFADYPTLPKICSALLRSKTPDARINATGYAGRVLPKSYMQWLNQPKMRIGDFHSAYLKIGEGCSNCCAYCSIPLIRGGRVSRSKAAILREAKELVDGGVRELNIIAQDTTAYGADAATGKSRFAGLLEDLLKIRGDIWFRVLYAHPKHLSEDMLKVMASDSRVCSYVDLPLQHISDPVLKAMGRGYTRRRVELLLGKIQKHLPAAVLRTTYILGHPGEGEAEFEELLDFVAEGHFEHTGVFVFSPEPGTRSATLRNIVPVREAACRAKALMKAQAAVSRSLLKKHVGREVPVLISDETPEGWLGRTMWQAPDVDGQTRVKRNPKSSIVWKPGDVVLSRITHSSTYDLTARPVV